jgi:hypothetical protein
MFTIINDIFPVLRIHTNPNHHKTFTDCQIKQNFSKYCILKSRLNVTTHHLTLGDVIHFANDSSIYAAKILTPRKNESVEYNSAYVSRVIRKILKGDIILHVPQYVNDFIQNMVHAMNIIRQYEMSHPECMPIIFKKTPHDRVKLFPRPHFTKEHIDIMIKHYNYAQTFMTNCNGISEYEMLTADMSVCKIVDTFVDTIDTMVTFFPNFVKLKKAANIFRDKPDCVDDYVKTLEVYENALRKTLLVKVHHMLPEFQTLFGEIKDEINHILTKMDIYDASEDNHITLIDMSAKIRKKCNVIMKYYLEPFKDISIVYKHIPVMPENGMETVFTIILDRLTEINAKS